MNEVQKLEEQAEKLVNLTVKEVKELLHILKEKHGIEPATAPTVTAAAPSEEKETPKEKTHFDVLLREIGPSKLAVVKAVKAITGQDLKTSKELVESAPKHIKKEIPKAEAEEIQKQLQEAGAAVELQ